MLKTCRIATPSHRAAPAGWIAYLGAANAGIPLSIIVKDYGWGAYFGTLLGAAFLALVLLAPMTRLKSYVQREAARKAKAA